MFAPNRGSLLTNENNHTEHACQADTELAGRIAAANTACITIEKDAHASNAAGTAKQVFEFRAKAKERGSVRVFGRNGD